LAKLYSKSYLTALTQSKKIVKIHYAGVNFIDVAMRRGWYPNPPIPTPFIPGAQGAGEVAAIAQDVTEEPAKQNIYVDLSVKNLNQPIPDSIYILLNLKFPSFHAVFSSLLTKKVNYRPKQ
jgi:hypothetical protein